MEDTINDKSPWSCLQITKLKAAEKNNLDPLNKILDVLSNPYSDQKSLADFQYPNNSIEKYIKKLQEAGYTIAIYTQDMQAKNTTRSLEEIISPGTYFSTDTRELSNNVMWTFDLPKISK